MPDLPTKPARLAADRSGGVAASAGACIARGAAAGLACAVLMALSAPPIHLGPIALVAAAPLAALARSGGSARARWMTLGAVLGAVPWWVWTHWWIWGITALGFAPMMLALAACTAAPVVMTSVAARRLPAMPWTLVFAVAWTGVETLRGEVLFHGYPWALLGHPLIDAPYELAAPGAAFGVYAASFCCAAVASGVAAAVGRDWRRGIPALAAALAVMAAGNALVSRPDTAGPGLRLGLVQTNLPQSNKLSWSIDREIADFRRFERLTVAAAGTPDTRPDVIVWPETMMPGPAFDPDVLRQLNERKITYKLAAVVQDGPKEIWATAFADRLLEVHRELKVPMLIGAEGVKNGRIDETKDGIRLTEDARFNSAFLVIAGRIDPTRYDKLRLTPFGEVIPYVSGWPWLQDRLLDLGAGGMKFDLSAGTTPRVFDVPSRALGRDVRVATPICFEVADAGVCRRLVFDDRGERRAEVMVNLTNDGWFGGSELGRLHHLQQARWRCLQLATPMARAANTGISALIDARGRVVLAGADEVPDEGTGEGMGGGGGAGGPVVRLAAARALFNVDGVLRGELRAGVGRTVYVHVGEAFGWVCLTLTGLLVLGASVVRRPISGMVPPKLGNDRQG